MEIGTLEIRKSRFEIGHCVFTTELQRFDIGRREEGEEGCQRPGDWASYPLPWREGNLKGAGNSHCAFHAIAQRATAEETSQDPEQRGNLMVC